MMNENDFEGTQVLEKLAEVDLLEDFYEAIDSDDIDEVVRIMKKANVDNQTMSLVLKKIIDIS